MTEPIKCMSCKKKISEYYSDCYCIQCACNMAHNPDSLHRRQWAQEGWRQHWLQMWGFIGQQYFIDRSLKLLNKLIMTGEDDWK